MNEKQLPNHIGIIMDGNGRWATSKGFKRTEGHKQGAEAFMNSSIYIFEKGIKYLSVFAFSTENFKREIEEVNYIMNLFILFFKTRMKEIDKRNIKVVFSGSKNNLSSDIISAIDKIVAQTTNNTNGTLNICLNYGSQDEIVDMTKKIAKDILNQTITIEDINKDLVSKNMYVDLPPLDFVIRTSGEYRISNFMMYQSSYAEFYFTPTLFPDFDKTEVDKALEEYLKRDRRFGQSKTTT